MVSLSQLNPIRWFYRLEPIEKFTAVLCVIGAFQLWAFVQGERAFVVADNARFENWPLSAGDKPLELIVEFKNIGKSIATFDAIRVAIGDGLPDSPNLKEGNRVTVPPLAANSKRPVTAIFGNGMGQQFISDLTSGKKKLYFFGRVSYWDEFSLRVFGPKATGFCFFFDPEKAGTPQSFDTCREDQYTYAN